MRRRAKIDANQPEIVKALRDMGATVQSLAAIGKGCPDLLVGHKGRNVLLEVKDGSRKPSERQLTRDEAVWHLSWKGQVWVVQTPEGAVAMVNIACS